jgi:hypothetical protein
MTNAMNESQPLQLGSGPVIAQSARECSQSTRAVQAPGDSTISDCLCVPRSLAPNVTALWPEDGPAITNPEASGCLPKGVSRLNRAKRLKPGAYAYLWSKNPTSPNRGVVVRLLSRYPDGDWEVEAHDRDLVWVTGKCSRRAAARPKELRRCPAPKGAAFR